jgi:hypothetical protein
MGRRVAGGFDSVAQRRETVARRYGAGESMESIAQALNISCTTVFEDLRGADLAPRRRDTTVKVLLDAGASIPQIAYALGLSRQQIFRDVKRLGLTPTRSQGLPGMKRQPTGFTGRKWQLGPTVCLHCGTAPHKSNGLCNACAVYKFRNGRLPDDATLDRRAGITPKRICAHCGLEPARPVAPTCQRCAHYQWRYHRLPPDSALRKRVRRLRGENGVRSVHDTVQDPERFDWAPRKRNR